METTVTCETCRKPMRPRSTAPDLGPSDWHPSDERVASILATVFQCEACGRVGIPQGLFQLRSSHPQAA
jgi:hypothetical protein